MDDNNAAMATAIATVTEWQKATAAMRAMALLIMVAKAKVRAEAVTMAEGRGGRWHGTEGNVGGNCRGVANGGGNCCCEGNDVGNNSSGGGGSGDNNGSGDVGSDCSDGDGRGNGTAMAVTSLLASGGGNVMTTDVCNAFLPRYADAVKVGSNNNGNCTPAIDEVILTGGLLTLTMACGAHVGGQRRQRGEGGDTGAGVGVQRWWQQCLDPTLLSSMDEEDTNDEDKYTVGNNGVDEPLAEDNENDDAPIAATNNDEPLADNINGEYAKGNEDNEYAKGKDDNEYAVGNNGVNEPLAEGNNDYDMPIVAADNNEPLANNINNEYTKDDVGILNDGYVHKEPSFDVLIGLFERIGLFTNATKTKVMVCIPGRIREGCTEEEYADYKSPTETSSNRKRCHVDCEICHTNLAAGSYQSHLELQHDVFCSMVLQRDIVVDCPPVVYRAIELLSAGTYFCLVPHCIGEASAKWALRQHFSFHHPQDPIVLPSEGTVPLPRCERCGMQIEVGALYGKHQHTWLCREGWERKKQHEAAEAARIVLARMITAHGEDLERVEVFKYLGQLLTFNDNDSQAMQLNLKKAHKSWARVSCVLRVENASPKVSGVFYKATVQAVHLGLKCGNCLL
jgi:hypothetical protein